MWCVVRSWWGVWGVGVVGRERDRGVRCADSYVRSVCFSPDSKYLVAGAEDKTIKLWDIQGKRLRHSLYGHTKDIYSVDYSADGLYVVSGRCGAGWCRVLQGVAVWCRVLQCASVS